MKRWLRPALRFKSRPGTNRVPDVSGVGAVNENLLTFLITQGGFAILAWYMIRQFSALQREAQSLVSRVLEVVERGAASETNLAGKLDLLTSEIVGLRRIGHDSLSWFSYFEQRLYEMESWRARQEGREVPPLPRPPGTRSRETDRDSRDSRGTGA